jgi:hypothetical protein
MTGTRLHFESNRAREAEACYLAYRVIEQLGATGRSWV